MRSEPKLQKPRTIGSLRKDRDKVPGCPGCGGFYAHKPGCKLAREDQRTAKPRELDYDPNGNLPWNPR